MKEALDLVAFGGTIAGRKVEGLKSIYESKPEEFMFHYGRSRIKPWLGQFWNNAIGTKTIGNHTSICEVAKWTGQELVFGKHFDVNDVENANYILNFGCNPLEAHTSHSYFAQRIVDAVVDRKVKLVTFDVRASNTASKSSEWIPIRPGADGAVILAMCKTIIDAGLHDAKFIDDWTTTSVAELKKQLAPFTPEFAEGESGVPAADIKRIALEYAKAKPGTCITYRGFVGHYNGTYGEMAAKTLDAICGNLGIKGGTNQKPGGKWEDPFKAIAKKVGAAKPAKLKIIDGENVILPTHHANHRVLPMIKEGSHGRPKVYMTYTYNPAYVTGDCQGNIDILKDESLIPFFVACDIAASEGASLSDLILPDSTYLERWTSEAPQSHSFTKFIQIRQPVTDPLGEARDFQQVLLDLAKKIGGKVAELMPYTKVEEYYRAAVASTAKKYAGYGVDGKKLNGDAFDYITKYGFIYQSTEPSHSGFLKEVKAGDGDIVDEATGVLWNPGVAHVSAADVEAKGYRGSKNAYKGYKGQKVGAKFHAGFKPDKINKSGRVELKTPFLAPGTPSGDAVQKILGEQLGQAMKLPRYAYLADHLKTGLPTYVPVPEHVQRTGNELIMTSFKVNVQIHSRSANCKWLSELYHDNPAWINATTAAKLGIKDGDAIRIAYADKPYPGRAYDPPARTSITTTARVTEMVHPDVVAVSFHCGHWEYGRYASGKAVAGAFTSGSKFDQDADSAVWKSWKHGEHPNWIIPNAPDPISGQWRSNDTVVRVSKV
ncbi:molybdopterin-dependent oxidoreductase, partial [bacterium]|nr:molybdopterin-dependent oxidoreductase [bacterium]